MALAGMGLGGATAQAAIKIEQATVQNDVAYVRGNGAKPGARITWEGFVVTTANKKNGRFAFFGRLPAECRGEVSEGVSSVEVAVLGCTPVAPAPVARTGQTVRRADGDDGHLQRGVASPTPQFTINVNAIDDANNNGICDGSETCNGAITDNLTGLIWLRNANCAGVGRTWAEALDDVASLNTSGTMNGNPCGDTSNEGSYQTDWRLPNLRELHSLVDYGQSDPSLPAGHPFTNFAASFYWSSTSLAAGPILAWFVYFFNGNVSFGAKTSTFFVLAVRGGS